MVRRQVVEGGSGGPDAKPWPMSVLRGLIRSKFIRSVATLSSGSGVVMALPILAAPLLGRIYGPDDYGPLAQCMSIAVTLGAASSLQYQGAIIAEVGDRRAGVAAWLCLAITLGFATLVGMVGNLKAPWFHWRAVEEIARRHPSARFVLWGPHRDPREATDAEGRVLRSSQVELRGLQAPRQIAVGSGEIDLWLLPFEPSRIPGGPLNSHKVLEYLATGRPVVMSCLEAYKGSRLVDVVEQETPEAFADAVDHAISRMDSSDADAQGSIRRSYAVDRLYEKRLEQICTACGLWRAGKR